MFRCVQTGFENDTVFTVAAGVEVRGNKEPEMRQYAIISVNLSGSGLGFEGWGELVWGCKAEESSQRQERERLRDWSRMSQSPLSKGTAPVTAC